MTNGAGKLAATIVLAASLSSLASVAPAAPISHALAIKNAVPTAVETVRARGECWRCSCGCRICCMADRAYYGYSPYYAAPYPYYAPPVASYCMQRYRSYDPASGTFLGYDGQRHPCR